MQKSIFWNNSIFHERRFDILEQLIFLGEKITSARTIFSQAIYNKKPKRLENSQLLRKTWHVNQIFE